MIPVSSLRPRPLTALALVLALSACAAPMPMPMPRAAAPQFAPPPAAMAGVQAPVTANQAEAACSDMARAQGLGVQSVVATREVAGADGQPVSRDVMLRVARGQQVYDVRCNYSYSADAARIMSL